MDISHARAQSLKVFSLLTLIFLGTLLVLYFFLNLFVTKLSNLIKQLAYSIKSASEGTFHFDINTNLGYETNMLERSIRQSFSKLQSTLTSIYDKVTANDRIRCSQNR